MLQESDRALLIELVNLLLDVIEKVHVQLTFFYLTVSVNVYCCRQGFHKSFKDCLALQADC